MRLGFVGVGAISEAVIEALLTGPNAADIEVVLSPRNAERSAKLAAKYSKASIGSSNQNVLDESDVVFMGVLPGQMNDVCAELMFRADHTVVSLIAGMPPSTVAGIVSPATEVVQMIPLPVIAMHAGPLVICPGNPAMVKLFEGCGEIVVLNDEAHIFILSCTSAAMSTFFEYQNTVINWSAIAGLPNDIAHKYATSLFKGLATEAMATPFAHLPEMPREHETPGGLNEHIRTSLIKAGMFDEVTKQLEHIYVTRNRTKKSD
jgi:pyrroline-5-carboxylate reductase